MIDKMIPTGASNREIVTKQDTSPTVFIDNQLGRHGSQSPSLDIAHHGRAKIC
jgi:hypothetical protein